MTPRQKNMLEAFQASSEEKTLPSGDGSPAPESAPKVQKRAKKGLTDVAPELFAAVLCVLVVGAFFIGRWSVTTTVRAADETTTVNAEVVEPQSPLEGSDMAPAMGDELAIEVEPALQPVYSEPELQPKSPLEVNHVAFEDPANVATVRVIYYDDTEWGQEQAYRTALYLSDLGFPAMIPVRKGGYVYICVGAAPSRSDTDLLRIQRELRQIPGPPPASRPGDFQSAYIYNIEKLISR